MTLEFRRWVLETVDGNHVAAAKDIREAIKIAKKHATTIGENVIVYQETVYRHKVMSQAPLDK